MIGITNKGSGGLSDVMFAGASCDHWDACKGNMAGWLIFCEVFPVSLSDFWCRFVEFSLRGRWGNRERGGSQLAKRGSRPKLLPPRQIELEPRPSGQRRSGLLPREGRHSRLRVNDEESYATALPKPIRSWHATAE